MKIFGKNLLKLITLDNWQFETKEKKFDKSIWNYKKENPQYKETLTYKQSSCRWQLGNTEPLPTLLIGTFLFLVCASEPGRPALLPLFSLAYLRTGSYGAGFVTLGY